MTSILVEVLAGIYCGHWESNQTLLQSLEDMIEGINFGLLTVFSNVLQLYLYF